MITELSLDSFDDFIEDGLVMVAFKASWCNPCKQLEPILENYSNEVNHNIGKVDVEKNREIAVNYGVKSIPTILVFRNGELVDRHVGMANKDKLKSLIENNEL